MSKRSDNVANILDEAMCQLKDEVTNPALKKLDELEKKILAEFSALPTPLHEKQVSELLSEIKKIEWARNKITNRVWKVERAISSSI